MGRGRGGSTAPGEVRLFCFESFCARTRCGFVVLRVMILTYSIPFLSPPCFCLGLLFLLFPLRPFCYVESLYPTYLRFHQRLVPLNAPPFTCARSYITSSTFCSSLLYLHDSGNRLSITHPISSSSGRANILTLRTHTFRIAFLRISCSLEFS